MAWKKQWKKDGAVADGAAADEVTETCPACTSAVDPQSETCTQCGAGLDYFRQQAAAGTTDEPEAESTGQTKE